MRATSPRSGRLFANVYYLSLGHVVAKATGLLGLAATAHYLSEAEFGNLSFAAATVMLVEVTNDLGISQAVARDTAADAARLRGDAIAALPLKLLLGALSVGAAAVVAFVLGAPENIVTVTFFIAISRSLAALTSLARAVFEGAERMEFEAISIAFEGVIRLALVLYALFNVFGLVGLAKAYVVASAVVFVSTAIFAVRGFLVPFPIRIEWSRARALLAGGLPFALYYFLGGLTLRANTVLLLPLAGSSATARFASSVRLIEPALVITFIFSVAVLPLAARHHSTGFEIGRALLASTQKVLFLTSGLILVIAWATAQEIVDFVLGPSYAQAVAPLRILAIAMVVLFAKEGLARIMLATHRDRQLLRAQLVTVVVDLAIAVALFPTFGAIAAAAAVLVSEIVGSVLAAVSMRNLLPSVSQESVIRPLAVVGAALACAVITEPLVLPLRFVLSVVTYLAAFAILRPLTLSEMSYIRSNLASLVPWTPAIAGVSVDAE